MLEHERFQDLPWHSVSLQRIQVQCLWAPVIVWMVEALLVAWLAFCPASCPLDHTRINDRPGKPDHICTSGG